MRISILLFDGFTMLDAVGGYAVLGWLPGAEVEFVAERKTIIADDLRSAGIDGALYLARLIAGEEIAKTIQLGIEYYPHPPWSGWKRRSPASRSHLSEENGNVIHKREEPHHRHPDFRRRRGT